MDKLKFTLKGLAGIACTLVLGCATYQSKVFKSRQLVESGQVSEATSQLKTLADQQGDDQLVYVLDYATLLQYSGNLKESNEYFFRALKLIDEFDYQSVSRVTGSLLFSEEMIQYKGDTFEKIFVNAYLALNFLEMNELDSALVETRRINQKYQKYRQEEKQNFEMNSFAIYLSAMIWEADGKYDDAFIAYKDAYKIDDKIGNIGVDLIRSAKKAQRLDEYKKLKAEFPHIKEDPVWYDKSQGDVVVVFQHGWGARKDFNPQSPRLPILKPVPVESRNARVSIEPVKKNDPHYHAQTEFLYSVDEAAIRTLIEDQGSLVARRMGGIVAKEVTADQIRQKNELLGFVAAVAMHASDRADLRQWSFLPKELQTARIRVKPGRYKVRLNLQNRYSETTGSSILEKEIEIRAGKTHFINWRQF